MPALKSRNNHEDASDLPLATVIVRDFQTLSVTLPGQRPRMYTYQRPAHVIIDTATADRIRPLQLRGRSEVTSVKFGDFWMKLTLAD